MAALYLVQTSEVPPFNSLGDGFSKRLTAFNDLTRDCREVGIEIKHLVLLDNTIFIEASSVELLSRRFGHELRGVRYSSEGRFTRNTVTIRGVDVVWFSLVKEQEK